MSENKKTAHKWEMPLAFERSQVVFRLHDGAKLPEYKHTGDAGADVVWHGPVTIIRAGRWERFETGLEVSHMTRGYEIQVRSRSGMASRFGVAIMGGVGTIDSGYRGRIGVALLNSGRESYVVSTGDRIAQLVFAPAPQALILDAATSGSLITSTERGAGGFGSSGR